MNILIWIGTAVSMLGLVGLAACIAIVARAKRAGLDDTRMRARLQKVVALNLGALMVSALGLMLVVVGIMMA